MHKGSWIHMGFMGWCVKLSLPERCCPERTRPGQLVEVRRRDGKLMVLKLESLLSGVTAGRGEIWSVADVVQHAVPKQEELQMACADKKYAVQGINASGLSTGIYLNDNGKVFDSLEKAQTFAENIVGKNRDMQYGPSAALIFESVAKVEVEAKPVKVTKIC